MKHLLAGREPFWFNAPTLGSETASIECPIRLRWGSLLKFSFLFLITISTTVTASAQSIEWSQDIDKVFQDSKANEKPILINFSGSDWCKPCILLTRNILETDKFSAFAEDNLNLLNADFPRLKKNRPRYDIMEERNKLAEKYNPNGEFPLVILISPDGKLLGKIAYQKGSVEDYIHSVKSLLKKYKKPIKTGHLLERKKVFLLMASRFEIAAVHQDDQKIKEAISSAHKEIVRIENLISSWNSNSETSLINRNAGIEPVRISKELFELIRRSLKISKLTNGAFDISFAAVNKLWTFNRKEIPMPNQQEIDQAISKINYQNIILNKETQTVFLKEKGMRIGFGAIGKGYAANKAKAVMRKLGIENGMVNAGGDLTAWGRRSGNKPWIIGISNPNVKGAVNSFLEINDQSIVTSGDYERYALIDGKRYSHIIDPRTGYPVTGLKSVTIMAKDAEICDGLATSVSVMGVVEGLKLINQMQGVECIMITDKDEMLSSKNIALSYPN